MEQKNRRQHYVGRFYLKSWADDGQIWCSRHFGEPYRSNLMNVAQERDFYKPRDLSEVDIEHIKAIAIESSPPGVQEMNLPWVDLFAKPFRFKRALQNKGLMSPEMEKRFEDAIHNIEEKLHGNVEAIGARYLPRLISGDASFFEIDTSYAEFILFLCTQYMRTKNMRVSIEAKAKAHPGPIDLEKIWSPLSHIFATSMGLSLYKERKKYRVLMLGNDSTQNLITGDQPVINTLAPSIKNIEATDVELYYPVSPKRAILITGIAKQSSEIVLSDSEVDRYNGLVAAQSHEQIYAAAKETLIRLIKIRHY